MRRVSFHHPRQRGFALLVVLWTVALVALLVSGLVAEARRDAKLTLNRRGLAVGRAAADAVISAAILDLLRKGAQAGVQPGQITATSWGAARVVVELENLSGRLNPNLSSALMLRAFLVRLGVDQNVSENLAAAIVDWRTPGQSPSPHGAKAAEYRAAGLPYGPPGRPFETLDELGAVRGISRPLLAAMKPHMTLWSTSDPVAAQADTLVLAALRLAGAPPVAAVGTEAQVIAITAAASLPDAPRVTRRAVVRFGYSPDGRGWRILTWDDGEAAPW